MSDEQRIEWKLPGAWVDLEKVYPLIECAWYECGALTRGKLATARGLLKIYAAERRIVAIGAGIAGGVAGLLVGLLIGSLRR